MSDNHETFADINMRAYVKLSKVNQGVEDSLPRTWLRPLARLAIKSVILLSKAISAATVAMQRLSKALDDSVS